jgi:uncharacterized RDD family membrane protein YckC
MKDGYLESIRSAGTSELYDIIRTINREKYPERLAMVEKEIANRKNPDFVIPEKSYAANSLIREKNLYDTTSQRFWASGIDGIICWLTTAALYLVFGMGVPKGSNLDVMILRTVYTIGMTWWFSKTLGKHFLGLVVIDHQSRKPVSFNQAIMRDIGSILCITLMVLATALGYLVSGKLPLILLTIAAVGSLAWTVLELVTMFSNIERRALHDKIAGTSVVIKRLL